MKIYKTITNDDIFRQLNFSEKEKNFVQDYIKNGGDVAEIYSFADYLQSGMFGAATGALTAAMAADKRKRKEAMKKGLLYGALGGLVGGSTSTGLIPTTLGFLGAPNVGGVAGGALGGYLAAMDEEED